MQHDIASKAEIIKMLIHSTNKMDTLDKIYALEARKKSSETMITDMLSDLCAPKLNTSKQQLLTPQYFTLRVMLIF